MCIFKYKCAYIYLYIKALGRFFPLRIIRPTCNSLEYTEMSFLYLEMSFLYLECTEMDNKLEENSILFRHCRKTVPEHIKGIKNVKRYIFHTVLLLLYIYVV